MWSTSRNSSESNVLCKPRSPRSSSASARWSSSSPWRCSPAATVCSSACRASRRRCSSRHWRASCRCASRASSSRRISCRPTSPAPRSSRRTPAPASASSSSCAGRSSRTSCWRTKSIARRRRRKRRCCRRCRNTKSPPAAQTHTLELPFFVLATQNPIEQEGTYPLPEAQLDRFMFNVKVGYPSLEEELQIVEVTTRPRIADPRPVLDGRADSPRAGSGAPRAGREPRHFVCGASGARDASRRDRRGAASTSSSAGAPGRAPASTWF